MALSTLLDDSFLCDFWKWSLSELLLRPAFFPQMGQTFIVGFRFCHSMETLPCSFRSRSNRTLANPSLGWARRWTRLRPFHASNKVKFLHHRNKEYSIIEYFFGDLHFQQGDYMYGISNVAAGWCLKSTIGEIPYQLNLHKKKIKKLWQNSLGVIP